MVQQQPFRRIQTHLHLPIFAFRMYRMNTQENVLKGVFKSVKLIWRRMQVDADNCGNSIYVCIYVLQCFDLSHANT